MHAASSSMSSTERIGEWPAKSARKAAACEARVETVPREERFIQGRESSNSRDIAESYGSIPSDSACKNSCRIQDWIQAQKMDGLDTAQGFELFI
jgi:hypothetical protein